jgi:glycosyltransferase involved in cell wall biosynthesis
MKGESAHGAKMRIGIVTQWPFPESSDYRCRKIVQTLLTAGHEVIVFTARATHKTFSIGDRTANVKSPWAGGALAGPESRSEAPIPGNPFWAVWLLRQARRFRLDWLMSKELRLGLSTYWATRVSKSKFWIDLSENYPGMVRIERRGQLLMPLHASVAAFLEKRCARSADLVTVVTESNRERLAQHGVSKAQLVVVSNTPVLQAMPTRNGTAAPGKLNVVYAGVLSRVRGLEQLLKALGQIGPERESIVLHIAGEGSEAGPLRTLTESLGLTNCVQFHGWVPNEKLPSLFVSCDVGIIPHLLTEFTQTTIPNKLFDYMACGLPVWTTNMRPCREIIEGADCGWVSEDSVDGMTAVLRHLLSTSQEERHAKGERGRQAVHSSYNWNVDGRRMLDALASSA